jgi:hypothetical protein
MQRPKQEYIEAKVCAKNEIHTGKIKHHPPELRVIGDEPKRQINACGQHTLLGSEKLVRTTITGSWTWQTAPWRPTKSSDEANR